LIHLDHVSNFDLLPSLLDKLINILVFVDLSDLTFPIVLLIVLLVSHDILIDILAHGQTDHKRNWHDQVWHACAVLKLWHHLKYKHTHEVSIGHFGELEHQVQR